MYENILALLTPLGVSVVMPVMIVWLTMRSATNADNKRAEILIEAIRNNSNVDVDKLSEALGKKRKSEAQMRQSRLLLGSMFSLIGVVCGIIALTVYNDSIKGWMTLAGGIALAVGIAYLIVFFYMVRTKDADCGDKDDRLHA